MEPVKPVKAVVASDLKRYSLATAENGFPAAPGPTGAIKTSMDQHAVHGRDQFQAWGFGFGNRERGQAWHYRSTHRCSQVPRFGQRSSLERRFKLDSAVASAEGKPQGGAGQTR